MYALNKIVWVLANPAMVGLLLLLAAFIWRKRWMIATGLLWVYLWSTPIVGCFLGGMLESPYANQIKMKIEDFPSGDAIADLGGGVGFHSSMFPYAQLNSSADRALHSARLWKAGKAPIVIPSGAGCAMSDGEFLKDLGVPSDAIVIENEARNTEENAKLIEKELVRRCQPQPSTSTSAKPKVLLVTSAWHMRRSMLMFEKYAPEVEAIPVICDVECLGGASIAYQDFLPSFECAGANGRYFHEWLGIFWYRWFRK